MRSTQLRKRDIVPQDRDLTLIRALAEDFRILTPRQINELVPRGSARRVNFRLNKLRDAGYLSYRPLASFGPGSTGGYYLGPKAAELFDPAERNAVTTIREQASKLAETGLAHRMLVDSIHIRFRVASRANPQFKLFTWIDQYSDWWSALRKYGVPIQADAYAECLVLFGFQNLLTLFLEVDRGTERGHMIEDKLNRYAAYAASGDYERLFAAGMFRVLFVTTSDARRDQLIKKMERLGPDVFWVTTWEAFRNSDLLAPHWRRPRYEGAYSLLSHT